MRYITEPTTLVAVRLPTDQERKERHAEIVFERVDPSGQKYTIYAASCYESWQQWGEISEVLSDNVGAVEEWRHPTTDAFAGLTYAGEEEEE